MTHNAEVLPGQSTPHRDGQQGSALVLALFVLVLLAGLGIALLNLTESELQMSHSSAQVKQAFYLAEAGLEHGRRALFDTDPTGNFSPELIFRSGNNDTMEFDYANVQPVYSSGQLIDLTGTGDDNPLIAIQPAGDEGWYAAYLTNNPGEADPRNDTDGRVIVTGIGVTRDRSVEIVQAVVEARYPVPALPTSAITLWGQAPVFASGSSVTSTMNGNDCGGADNVPIVSTLSDQAETAVEAGYRVNGPGLSSGGYDTAQDTFANLLDPANEPTLPNGYALDSAWQSCQELIDLIEGIRPDADHLCEPPTVCSPADPATLGPSSIVFIDGDLALSSGDSGQGMLVVTGMLELSGGTSWDGVIMVIGEGNLLRNGGGSGYLAGGVLVADVAGFDDQYGTADDCCMNPPACDSPPDGFGPSTYEVNGGGNANINYCASSLNLANSPKTYEVIDFAQR